MENRQWSDRTILKDYKNTCWNHEHQMETNELTFFGFPEQPDFGHITIDIEPKEKMVDLKSVKKYLLQFRSMGISYERLLNTVFEDFMAVYEPVNLTIILKMNPRGGIASTLKKSTKDKELE
jgi:7-cyano-7-deazaguanine reductase